ncbi:MAG: hypothetical protein JOZ73_03695 [Solirubrobacterales bacterium]|nr:hypothetical protein [Solirubrobacterales bacterium]
MDGITKFSALRSARLLICLAAVAAALTVAACGSAGSRTSTGVTSGAQFQARLNLAKCFRAHGINVPDPSSGGGAAGGGGGGIFRTLRQYPQAQIQTARQACQQYFAQAFPQLNLSPAQRAQFQQQLVKFAQCMRSHGINVPDPTFNGNGPGPGGGFGFRRAFGSVDRNSPAFQSASQACASLRPRFGRGGGGGGAGGPGG